MLSPSNERAEEGVCIRDELAREGTRRVLTSALEEEVESVTRRLAAVGAQRPSLAWRITCGMGTLEVQGPRSTTGGSMSTRSGAGWRAGACRRTCVPRRKSRRCCWCGICAGCRRGPRPGARDPARGGCCGIVGDEHSAADGSMRYAWKSSSSSFASASLGGCHACTCERRSAIRCRSQTDLDTPSVEYPTTHETNCHDYPSANTEPKSRLDV
jgi:hypothetical protein